MRTVRKCQRTRAYVTSCVPCKEKSLSRRGSPPAKIRDKYGKEVVTSAQKADDLVHRVLQLVHPSLPANTQLI